MDEKLLREILATTKENNEILKRLNFQRKWLNVYWFIKWGIIFALAYSAYLASKPYIDQAQDALNNINSFNTQVKAYGNMDQRSFTDFLRNEIQKRIGQ